MNLQLVTMALDDTTVSDVFSGLTTVFEFLMEQFTTTVSTITSNSLLFVSVIVALGGGLILAGVKLVRKLGVRGLSSRRH